MHKEHSSTDAEVLSVVIKIGTSTLTSGTMGLDRAKMLEIVRSVAAMKKAGHNVTLVSSGAVAAGREVVKDHASLPKVVSSKQLLASVGQGRLIEAWESLFSIYGITIGQILLTGAELQNRERFLNARDTLFAMLEHGIVPVINENDALSTAEIKVGDNDTLSAITAAAIEADVLILLTDQKGLYDADPRSDPDAKLISVVDRISDSLFALAGGAGTAQGTGGMYTKVKAAKIATEAGVELIIASGEDPAVLPSLIRGEGECTRFKTSKNPMELRKLWLSSGTRAEGSVTVDSGAAEALRSKGSSLLPSGIVKVSGEFVRGAVIAVTDASDTVLAKGIARYSSSDLDRIRGLRTDEIEKVLGFSNGVAVHRNDLVLS